MAIVTVRPNATRYNDMSVDGGAGSAHASLNDNSDSTALAFIVNLYTNATIEFDGYTIPAGAFIKAVRYRLRYSTVGGSVVGWFSTFVGLDPTVISTVDGHNDVQAARSTQTFGWRTFSPYNTYWSQADINELALWIWAGYYQSAIVGLGLASITEAYIDIDVNYNPTTTVTGPATTVTTTTRPIVTFTYADADGDPMESYQIRVFDSATYSAGGFDPKYSPAVWDSGKVFAPSPVPVTIGTDLAQGGTYRAYVFVAQAGALGTTLGNGISDGTAYRQFTINVTPPTVPTLAVSVLTVLGIIRSKITVRATDSISQFAEIQTTINGGTIVRAPRYLQNIPITNSADTITYDPEVLPNIPTQYRARAKYTSGGSTIVGAWSGWTSAITVAYSEWYLRRTSNVIADLGMYLDVVGPNPFAQKSPEDKAFFNPLGRTKKVSVTDTIKGEEGDLLIDFLTESDFQLFETYRNLKETLLLIRGWTNERWFIQLGQIREMDLFNYTPIYRQVRVSWVEVDAPPV